MDNRSPDQEPKPGATACEEADARPSTGSTPQRSETPDVPKHAEIPPPPSIGETQDSAGQKGRASSAVEGDRPLTDAGSDHPARSGGQKPRSDRSLVSQGFSALVWPLRFLGRSLSSGIRRLFVIRKEIHTLESLLLGLLCVATCFGLWWWATAGQGEERMLSPAELPSPAETFGSFKSLWFDRALTRNLYASLRRVILGFGLAAAVGIPIGVLAGCFRRVQSFFAPLTVFGRNIPIAALIPLTFSLFGIQEMQKIMFIFIACVAFIISDTAHNIASIDQRYIDTAYTLGARRKDIVLKVLVPLSMPDIVSSLRVLFGLAFGYIMLAELVKLGGESGGLGDIIMISQRRGKKEHILLVLLIIPLVAMALDRILLEIQRQLYPHRYGGAGILHRLGRLIANGWEDLTGFFRRGSSHLLFAASSAGTPGANPSTSTLPPALPRPADTVREAASPPESAPQTEPAPSPSMDDSEEEKAP
ncbi:MAG: ABC transporter permease subunit [Bradymonadales bacterium]|nr:ABC transporter permease subunit [Bradymonadales bacterium]